jgi:NADH-quinone oxidoreductase subunit N
LLVAAPHAPRTVTPLLVIDRYAIFYTGLILVASFAVALLAFSYLERHEGKPEEFYLLLLLATLGSVVLVSSNHFASFFLGLEILSVSLYPLIAYQRRNLLGIEAGVKYLVLAGVSSAFLLFGMALVYADLGTLLLPEIAAQIAKIAHPGVLLLTGFGLIMVGIGFKLALVPFHLWTPDVYQGAPAPVTAFVATVSKGAMFALLLRYFTQVNFQQNRTLVVIFAVMAVASMLVGNLLALLQDNLKRLLAYSSIAHLGYLLVALLASGPLAMTAVAYYLVAYFVMTLGAFGIVIVLSGRNVEADTLEDYEGLAWRRPWMAALLTATLLSLAGIPLTAGFVGKFYVLAAGAESRLWWLLIIMVATSSIGLFYYLRVVVIMYRLTVSEADLSPVKPSLSLAGSVALAALTLLLVWLGVYPAPLIRIIQTTLAGAA